jgi:bacillithiol system protein YtxJ
MFFQNEGIQWFGAITNNSSFKEVLERSETVPVGIYRDHSQNTIAITTRKYITRYWDIPTHRLEMYACDAQMYKSAANIISTSLGIRNEVAQLLILYKNDIIYMETQAYITMDTIRAALDKHFPDTTTPPDTSFLPTFGNPESPDAPVS